MGVEQLPVKHTFIHFQEPVCQVVLARALTCPDLGDYEASTAVPSPEQSEHSESDDQVSEMDAREPFLCDATPETRRHLAQLTCVQQQEEDPFMMDTFRSSFQQCCFVPSPCAPTAFPLEQGMCPGFYFNCGVPVDLPAKGWSDDQSVSLATEPVPVREPTEMPASADDEDSFTTVMLRNVPNNMTREQLLEMLQLGGFHGSYDFVYLPIDFKREANLGYAFVNFVSHQAALRARFQYSGFQAWNFASEKVCETAWSKPWQQGYAKSVERYRNSPVMRNRVPDSYKPVVFNQGYRVPFPPPSKKSKAVHTNRSA